MFNLNAYHELTALECLWTWLPYFCATSFIVVAWVFKLGEVVRHHLAARFKSLSKLNSRTDWIFGIWFSYTVNLAFGILGVFSVWMVIVGGLGILAYAGFRLKIGFLPRLPLRTFWREEKFLAVVAALGAFLYGWASCNSLLPWFDGLFVVSGGHMARTGQLLPLMGEGQHGMSVLAAMTSVFFPQTSVLNPISAWAPWHAPFILGGSVVLCRAVLGTRRFDPLAILIFALPLAFKAGEIRGSVIGVGFFLWTTAFLFRYAKSKLDSDLLLAIFSLASAWNYSPATTIKVFLFYLAWAAFDWVAGRRQQWIDVWKLFFFTSVLQFPHLVQGFAWSKVDRAIYWSFLAPIAAMVLSYLILRLSDRPVKPRSQEEGARWRAWVLPGLTILAFGWAYWVNPVHSPTFNWVFFAVKASFLMLNFQSYGLLGYLYGAILILALFSCRRDEGARFLVTGFLVSCFFQIIPIYLLKFDLNPMGERPYIWDVWKNAALYWNNPFMVVAYAWGLKYAAEYFKRVHLALTPRRVGVGAALAMILPLQTVAPYRALFFDDKKKFPWLERVMHAHLAKHTANQWRGQQTYSFPMYAAFATGAVSDHWLGRPIRAKGCDSCTANSYAFMKVQSPLIDTLIFRGAGIGETFVTGDSVTNFETYMRRRVHYRDGPDTICPIYIAYWNDLTIYEKYWQDKLHIRRNAQGMFYTVDEPEKNLVWVKGPDLRFQVPYDGEWDLYRGTDLGAAPARISIGGVDRGLSSTSDAPFLSLGRLEKGKDYVLSIDTPDDPAKGAGVPIVVYPKRDWALERRLVDTAGSKAIGFLALMKFTSIPSAEVTVEDLHDLFGNPDPAVRAKTVERWRIRYLILDEVITGAFPQAEMVLSADPAFERLEASGTVIYRRI